MKSLLKLKSILLIVLASGALVFAGGGLECDSCGQPPRGIGIDGNATGTKLTGVITIEFYNIVTTPGQTQGNADARFLLRLRKGNDFAVFYEEAFVTDLTNPAVVQQAIQDALTQDVLDRFFNGANKTVKVKALEEFGELKTPTTTDLCLPSPTSPTNCSNESVFVLSDVVLAVQ